MPCIDLVWQSLRSFVRGTADKTSYRKQVIIVSTGIILVIVVAIIVIAAAAMPAWRPHAAVAFSSASARSMIG